METQEELRPYLFAIAYRMLGSVADAEDVVQETFLRYHAAEVEPESPKAYLATITTRLALDQLRSARTQREVYPGEWLPEPLAEEDAARHAEMADSLSLSFLHLLEKLSPVERARYIEAWETGDTDALVAVLAPDATVYGDGGGKAPAIREPLVGARRVAKALIGWRSMAIDQGVTYRTATVNGEPGVVYYWPDGQVAAVEELEIADGLVVAVRTVLNPDKLAHLAAG